MRKINFYALAAGLVFILSAVAKACDTELFSEVIVSYGFPQLSFLAPAVILVEMLLGLMLVFQIKVRLSAAASLAMVAVFTAFYTYALVFKGIKDCGCFGRLTALNTRPWFTYLRNLILMGLTVFALLSKENGRPSALWVYALITLAFGATAGVTGYTFRPSDSKPLRTKPLPLSESPLGKLIETSPDSTYLVFAFSYACPHCLNSIGNLKEYEAAGVADKVIGLALGDTLMENRFFRPNFHPNFPIQNHLEDLLELTDKFPRAYYIQNNEIRLVWRGDLPCALIFSEYLPEKSL